MMSWIYRSRCTDRVRPAPCEDAQRAELRCGQMRSTGGGLDSASFDALHSWAWRRDPCQQACMSITHGGSHTCPKHELCCTDRV